MKTKAFRDRHEFLKHAVEDDDKDEIREYSAAVQNAYSRMRRVYLGVELRRPRSDAVRNLVPRFDRARNPHSGFISSVLGCLT